MGNYNRASEPFELLLPLLLADQGLYTYLHAILINTRCKLFRTKSGFPTREDDDI